MIRELDTVALTHDFDEHGLQAGYVGAVVHDDDGGDTYEVEFTTAEGTTVGVLTLNETAIWPLAEREILHVRELTAA